MSEVVQQKQLQSECVSEDRLTSPRKVLLTEGKKAVIRLADFLVVIFEIFV